MRENKEREKENTGMTWEGKGRKHVSMSDA